MLLLGNWETASESRHCKCYPTNASGSWGGMRWCDLSAANESQRWDLTACSPVGSRGKGSHDEPVSQINLEPGREKDELILPKPFSWHTSMNNVRLVRAKIFSLGKGDWKTVVPGQSTTIFFILTNFVFSSGQMDLAKIKQSQVSWVSVLCARWRPKQASPIWYC